MSLRVYNTLTRRKEEFQPLNPLGVKMYVCGITPYDETHLGHGRAYVTFDLIRRWLEYSGYKVIHVQNITDVDDKIIKKGQGSSLLAGQAGGKCQEIVEKYTRAYFEVMDKLNIKRADIYPKATEHIPEMIRWIESLVAKGFAYILEDGVYFSVDKFPDYGKLSGRRKEEQEVGARVGVDLNKKNPLDFALWKKAKEGEPFWESSWGPGRPGWHIECSVMSTKYLEEQFDIHGGGLDLEFPHHENEIAQTEALTGKVPWVKYWVHNGFVNINRQKMSKSLGNFFTLREIFEKYDPMVVRFFLLSTHYRSPINYSDLEITSAKEAFSKIGQFIQDLKFLETHPLTPSLEKRGRDEEEREVSGLELDDLKEELTPYQEKYAAALDDDFNSAVALAVIFGAIRFCRKALEEGEAEKECLAYMRDFVVKMCGVLGLVMEDKKLDPALKAEVIEKMIIQREEARTMKKFKEADSLRQQLLEQGIVLEDTPYGTKWKVQT